MIWPFRRKKKPVAVRPPINEDWRVGDFAACITAAPWIGGSGPALGSVCEVLAVVPGYIRSSGEPAWGLQLKGWDGLYHATNFRKLVRDKEECSAEFKALINLALRKRKKTGAAA